MEREYNINGNTVVIAGSAISDLISIGSYDEENTYITRWLQEPEIIAYHNTFVDCHNDLYDLKLTPKEEKEILSGVDINDFVI